MDLIKKIVVGVDFSDYSLPQLRYAAALAQDVDAELVVVNVINQRDVDAIRTAEIYTEKHMAEGYVTTQKEERHRMVKELLEQAACTHVPHQIVVKVGHPVEEIVNVIEQTGADLCIVGTKGRTNLSHVIFGSVAERLHRRCPVSILSVRGKEHSDLVCKMPV
jgi:nucleotide-binding universal stress UspA family protein